MAENPSHPMQVEEASVQPNPLPFEKDNVLIAFADNEEDKILAKDLYVALSSSSYEVREHSPRFDTDVQRQRIFQDAVQKSQKLVLVVSSDYINHKFIGDIGVIEQVTQRKGRKILIPVLREIGFHALPARLVEAAVMDDAEDYITSAENFQLKLCKYIDDPAPLIPNKTNQGVGLANGHVLNYLTYILPPIDNTENRGFASRTMRAYQRDVGQWDCSGNAKFCPKNITLIPLDCASFKFKLSDYDADIKDLKYRGRDEVVKVRYARDMPGFTGKSYDCCLSVANVDGQEYIFSAEIPSTLNTLYTMRQCKMYESIKEVEQEKRHFYSQLNALLHDPRIFNEEGRSNIIVLPFNYDYGIKLSKIIADAINLHVLA